MQAFNVQKSQAKAFLFSKFLTSYSAMRYQVTKNTHCKAIQLNDHANNALKQRDYWRDYAAKQIKAGNLTLARMAAKFAMNWQMDAANQAGQAAKVAKEYRRRMSIG